ncbi:hypothetical protein Hdeb2414_s0026g00677981 [Helianthus debilis subsp. tardiflorus]
MKEGSPTARAGAMVKGEKEEDVDVGGEPVAGVVVSYQMGWATLQRHMECRLVSPVCLWSMFCVFQQQLRT